MKRDLATEAAAGSMAEATVQVPQRLLFRLVENALNDQAPLTLGSNLGSLTQLRTQILPPIGAPMQDGTFAGVTLEGDQRAALILLPGDESLKWEEAMKWAAEKDGVLPSRIDQLVLFANLKGEFKKDYYWSSAPYAGNEGYAWYQTFDYGGQLYDRKGLTCRARAVRRLVLQ